MSHTVVKIDGKSIHDRESFHDVFARAMGFPDFYGRNRDAWLDCMTSLDAPEEKLTSVHAPPGGVLVLQIDNVDAFAAQCPEQFSVLVEDAASVNWRRLYLGKPPVLALSFHRSPHD